MAQTLSDTVSQELGENLTRVKIIGVGGGGCNGVDRLQLDPEAHVELAAMNTDAQALATSLVGEKLLLGRKLTRGLSCGGNAELGTRVGEAETSTLKQLICGIDLVFILAGLGGGTGSGVAPVLARLAAEQGTLVIAFVTRPFSLEGERRLLQADDAIVALREHCSAVIPLPNDLLLQHMDESATVLDAFEQADAWISRGIRSICAMVFRTGLINIDFATLQTAFCKQSGKTLFALGRGEGECAVEEAIKDLELCPLVHTHDHARRADRLLINIIGGPELGMAKVQTIMARATELFSSGEHAVIGAVIDESYQGRVEICVLGTTDMDTNRYMKRVQKGRETPTTAAIAEKKTPANTQGSRATHTSKLSRKAERLVDTEAQEEFHFISDDEQRGYFDKTEKNLYDGQDLDVPTYLRRGIRIEL